VTFKGQICCTLATAVLTGRAVLHSAPDWTWCAGLHSWVLDSQRRVALPVVQRHPLSSYNATHFTFYGPEQDHGAD